MCDTSVGSGSYRSLLGNDSLSIGSVSTSGGTNTLSHSFLFFFSSRRRHTRLQGDWSSDVCSSDLSLVIPVDRCPHQRSHAYLGHRRVLENIAERFRSWITMSPSVRVNYVVNRVF